MSKKLLMEALNKVDEKVMTPEMKDQISEAFDAQLKAEVDAEVKTLTESIEKSTEEYVQKIVESHVADRKETFDKAVSAKTEELLESAKAEIEKEYSEKLNAEFTELVEGVEKYAQHAAKAFIEENKSAWEDEVAVIKANKIMESVKTMAEMTSADLSKITDGESGAREELDKAVDKIADLEKQIAESAKEKVISEACVGLSLPEADKLKSLVESVDFKDEKSYAEKVDLFKKTLVAKDEQIDESHKEQKPAGKTPSWK